MLTDPLEDYIDRLKVNLETMRRRWLLCRNERDEARAEVARLREKECGACLARRAAADFLAAKGGS